MKKFTLILFTVLSTSFIKAHDQSNNSSAIGAMLFAGSVGLTIAHQKFNNKQVDESQELANKALQQNHTQLNLPQQSLPINNIDLNIKKNQLQKKLLDCDKKQELKKLILEYHETNNTYEIDKLTNKTLSEIKEPDHNNNDLVKEYKFINNNITSSNIAIFVSIHGSNTNADSFGKNPNDPLSQKFLRYVKANTLTKHSNTIFIPFEWNGKIDEIVGGNHRQNAGKDLGNIIENKLQELNSQYHHLEINIIFIGHSHGGNVANEAAIVLLEKNIHINKLISFAGPALQSDPSENIDSILNFYGKGDGIGPFGSLFVTGGKSAKLHKTGSNITNIELTNGSQLDHFNTNAIGIHNLLAIEDYLANNLINEKNILLNISNKTTDEILDSNSNDASEIEEITLESAKKSNTKTCIYGFINEINNEKAFDLEAIEQNPNFDTSFKNQQEFTKNNPGYPIYKKPNILLNAYHELVWLTTKIYKSL